MESNRNKRTTKNGDLTETVTGRTDSSFLNGFRFGYSCGRADAYDEISCLDGYETGYENGFEDGYDEGFDDAEEQTLCGSAPDEETETKKPTDEESLLDFLDSLSLAEQRAALVHLSGKWAELGTGKSNEQ